MVRDWRGYRAPPQGSPSSGDQAQQRVLTIPEAWSAGGSSVGGKGGLGCTAALSAGFYPTQTQAQAHAQSRACKAAHGLDSGGFVWISGRSPMAPSGEGMRWQQQQGSPGVRPVFSNAPLLPNDFMWPEWGLHALAALSPRGWTQSPRPEVAGAIGSWCGSRRPSRLLRGWVDVGTRQWGWGVTTSFAPLQPGELSCSTSKLLHSDPNTTGPKSRVYLLGIPDAPPTLGSKPTTFSFLIQC